MNFDPSIGLGSIMTLGLLLFGGIGAWFTFKSEFKENRKKVELLDNGHTKLSEKLSGLELQVAKECVKRDDLREVEQRLGKRLDDVEHTVRNSVTKMTGELKDIMREMIRGSGGRP